LNLIDEFTCQALGIDIDSLPAERVFCLLEQVKAWRALPMTIRVDNGPEFVAEALADWVSGTACCGPSSQGQLPEQLLDRAVQQEFREHILDGYPFESLDEVRDAAWTWLLDYAKKRSHDTPDDLTAGAAAAARVTAGGCLYEPMPV
jgi:putative transposase